MPLAPEAAIPDPNPVPKPLPVAPAVAKLLAGGVAATICGGAALAGVDMGAMPMVECESALSSIAMRRRGGMSSSSSGSAIIVLSTGVFCIYRTGLF
jgi:hypothetical protein